LRIGPNPIRVWTTGRIAKIRGYGPSFSPDGRLIVYCAPEPKWRIGSELMIS
jgi:hypothetical protein